MPTRFEREIEAANESLRGGPRPVPVPVAGLTVLERRVLLARTLVEQARASRVRLEGLALPGGERFLANARESESDAEVVLNGLLAQQSQLAGE